VSTLAKNIRLIREELGCSQLMMSKLLSIGFRSYVRYEAGKRDIPVLLLVKLAHLGGISLDQILNNEINNCDILPVTKTSKVNTLPEVKLIDFCKGLIAFKNPKRSELITIDSSEKRILTLFRKMDADLQTAFIQSLNSFSNITK
jgi:transcriptional regulator with XRE-family HTH domain